MGHPPRCVFFYGESWYSFESFSVYKLSMRVGSQNVLCVALFGMKHVTVTSQTIIDYNQWDCSRSPKMLSICERTDHIISLLLVRCSHVSWTLLYTAEESIYTFIYTAYMSGALPAWISAAVLYLVLIIKRKNILVLYTCIYFHKHVLPIYLINIHVASWRA